MAKEKEEKKVDKELTKEETIAEVRKKLEKDFGKGTLMGAVDKPKVYDCVSTGSLGLDKALGIGGLPRGRIIEIYGPESSGKTTIATHVIAEAHKDPESHCVFIDVEHALDTGYCESLGVDLERLQISQPDYGEQALEVASQVIESGAFDVVVIDSVAALVPKSELEGEMGEASMGKHARLMSQALRKLTALTAKTGTILIFINQMRDKIGVMFGSPETTTGGNALKFYASVRLDVRRSITKDNSVIQNKGKDNEVILGNQTTVKVIKNKTAPPFKKCTFDILYGEGIDKYGELIDVAVDCGVIEKSGTWFSHKGKQLGQGRDAVRENLKADETMYDMLKGQVVQLFKPAEFIAVPEGMTKAQIVDNE